MENPFDDIVPREIKKADQNQEVAQAPVADKQFVNNKNVTKNKNFLSFQDDEDELGDTSTPNTKASKSGFFKKRKIQSSHEVLKDKDPTLSSE